MLCGEGHEAEGEEDGSLAVVAATTGATGKELPSEQVVVLSKGDGITEDAEAAASVVAQEPTA